MQNSTWPCVTGEDPDVTDAVRVITVPAVILVGALPEAVKARVVSVGLSAYTGTAPRHIAAIRVHRFAKMLRIFCMII